MGRVMVKGEGRAPGGERIRGSAIRRAGGEQWNDGSDAVLRFYDTAHRRPRTIVDIKLQEQYMILTTRNLDWT